MAKLKGLFKGMKCISNMFVYKEIDDQEMSIGYPTDVKHVAHVGWDDSSMNPPSWINEFKESPGFSSESLSNFGQSIESSWSSQDFEQPRSYQQVSDMFTTPPPPRPSIPKAPKKPKRRKPKRTSSPTSARSSKSSESFVTALDEADRFQGQIRVN